MNREWVKEATTIELVNDLIACKQGFVDVSKARFWSFRKRWRKSHKLKAFAQKSELIAKELSFRYEVILRQMSRRAKGGPLTQTEWVNCQTAIWELFRDNARTMTNYRRFSGVLWDICQDQLKQFGDVASFAALQPKFMLRQFVDDMPSSDERGLLLASAFGQLENKDFIGKELVDVLTRAFPVLHLQVLGRMDDLSALTDGVITAEMARRFTKPFTEYRRWLFES